jgi:hypothetical protein
LIVVEEPPMYGGRDIKVGSETFVWFSETDGGGRGLAWHALVAKAQRMTNGRIRLTLRLASKATSVLGIAQLSPFRNISDGSAQAELSRKLYYHSHNKIAAVTASERAFLISHFR